MLRITIRLKMYLYKGEGQVLATQRLKGILPQRTDIQPVG